MAVSMSGAASANIIATELSISGTLSVARVAYGRRAAARGEEAASLSIWAATICGVSVDADCWRASCAAAASVSRPSAICAGRRRG